MKVTSLLLAWSSEGVGVLRPCLTSSLQHIYLRGEAAVEEWCLAVGALVYSDTAQRASLAASWSWT